MAYVNVSVKIQKPLESTFDSKLGKKIYQFLRKSVQYS